MRNRNTEARIFVRGDELLMLKKLSTKEGVGLTEMVRILITNAERAGVKNGKINQDF
ncbi:TPA: hypothetical protein NKT21_004086 [Vibrio parahaemolyticus]|uniref:hypothetical protein n=1 Tax=Vibrio sp. Isolate24 TaxID=2908534 RepID=UPI001EFC9B51|nr:hypothetical protein [Vibrio sp. Isolate24]MBE3681693.1 hypothetical protein [Vibrio parahaemolyticus]MCG9680485.1 hypothetical protein [Vibrio sp. Isolate24]HCH2844795.1 hypothetical protein [Vibrio parahaemolyticus]